MDTFLSLLTSQKPAKPSSHSPLLFASARLPTPSKHFWSQAFTSFRSIIAMARIWYSFPNLDLYIFICLSLFQYVSCHLCGNLVSRHWLRWQLQLLPRIQQQSPGHCHLRCAKTSLSHFKCLNAKKIKKHSFFPPEAGPENLEAPWDCTCKAASKESPTCACRRSQAILLPTSKMHSKCPSKLLCLKNFARPQLGFTFTASRC